MQNLPNTKLTKNQSYWLAHIRKANTRDQSYSAYARLNDLNVQQLYQYQHVLRKKGILRHNEPPVFNKLSIQTDIPALPAKPDRLSLYFPNGMRLAFSSSLNLQHLSEVIQQIGSCHATPRQ